MQMICQCNSEVLYSSVEYLVVLHIILTSLDYLTGNCEQVDLLVRGRYKWSVKELHVTKGAKGIISNLLSTCAIV